MPFVAVDFSRRSYQKEFEKFNTNRMKFDYIKKKRND